MITQSPSTPTDNSIEAGAMKRLLLEIDVIRRSVVIFGVKVALTPMEVQILHALVQSDHASISRSQLMIYIWEKHSTHLNNHLDVAIYRLRTKLKNHLDRRVTLEYFNGYYHLKIVSHSGE